MSRSDDDDAWRERQDAYSAKQRKIRDAGYDNNELEREYEQYIKAFRYVEENDKNLKYYKSIMHRYKCKKIRWEDFD